MSRGEHGVDRLHALVDGQLNAAGMARLLEQMDRDPALRHEVWELYRVKGYVTSAFENPPPAPSAPARTGGWRKIGVGMAAALLLLLGFAGGRWSMPTVAPLAIEGHNHVILHVSSADKGKFLTALNDAETLAA